MVIASRNPVHSVLFLILAFVNAAGLFLLLGAEFLAMILVVVYVGAVAVLFLFVVMMLDVDFAELRQGFLQYLPIGGLIGLIFLVELVAGRRRLGDRSRTSSRSRDRGHPADGAVTNTEALGRVLYTQYVYFFQAAGLDPARRHDRRHRADAARPRRRQAPEHRRPGRARRRTTAIEVAQGAVPGRACSEMIVTIGLGHYLTVAAILFTLGVLGIFLNRKNVIVILMSIELILLAVNINLVAFSTHPGRHRRPGLRAARAHGRGRRSRDRARHSRRLLSATAARSRSKTST